MNKTDSSALLNKFLISGRKAARWLERSKKACESIRFDAPLSDDDFDRLENLTSRFARLSDILLQKILRLLDQVMLETPGSIRSCLNWVSSRREEEENRSLHEVNEDFPTTSNAEIAQFRQLLIDIINRAEKRGICEALVMRNIRELRNAIAHEYAEEQLLALFSAVQNKTNDLLDIFRRCEQYILDQNLAESSG